MQKLPPNRCLMDVILEHFSKWPKQNRTHIIQTIYERWELNIYLATYINANGIFRYNRNRWTTDGGVLFIGSCSHKLSTKTQTPYLMVYYNNQMEMNVLQSNISSNIEWYPGLGNLCKLIRHKCENQNRSPKKIFLNKTIEMFFVYDCHPPSLSFPHNSLTINHHRIGLVTIRINGEWAWYWFLFILHVNFYFTWMWYGIYHFWEGNWQ